MAAWSDFDDLPESVSRPLAAGDLGEAHRQCMDWLNRPDAFPLFLGYISHLSGKYPGNPDNPQTYDPDALDCWMDFCVEKLGGVLEKYTPTRGKFRPLLLSALLRFVIDRWRRKSRVRVLSLSGSGGARAGMDPPAPDSSDPAAAATRAEAVDAEARTREQLSVALASLSAYERQLFREKLEQGRTHREIAASLGKPEGTVDAQVFRALRKLRLFLMSDPDVSG
ncbi:MAG: sigma-70 family RNA polymerase sigma factor [Planctomycetes bacterium]|nr:sigma-70 family RNA polymerase sigma factor [Planctomycetota bacterium]